MPPKVAGYHGSELSPQTIQSEGLDDESGQVGSKLATTAQSLRQIAGHEIGEQLWPGAIKRCCISRTRYLNAAAMSDQSGRLSNAVAKPVGYIYIYIYQGVYNSTNLRLCCV